jgi:hypothetical protein
VQGQSAQLVKVRSKEVSVHLGSYPGEGEGDRTVEASGTEIRLGRVCERTGRNASEAWAGPRKVECERRGSSHWTKAGAGDRIHRHVKIARLAGVVGAARTHAVTSNTGGPLAGPRRRAQEGLPVLANDLMEHGVLGVTRAIHGLNTRHSSGYRAHKGAPMPTDGYADTPGPGLRL